MFAVAEESATTETFAVSPRVHTPTITTLYDLIEPSGSGCPGKRRGGDSRSGPSLQCGLCEIPQYARRLWGREAIAGGQIEPPAEPEDIKGVG